MHKLLITLVFLTTLLLCACSSTPEKQILSVNRYTQTNYNYNCLDTSKTFTEIIICYKAQDKAEKMQNDVTNQMISASKEKPES